MRRQARGILRQLGLSAAVAMALCGFVGGAQPKAKEPEPLPARQFQLRLNAYLKLRAKLVAGAGRLKPTDSQQAIAARSQLLARKIRAARAGARVGDIFTPAVTAEFRRLIGISLQGKDAEQI